METETQPSGGEQDLEPGGGEAEVVEGQETATDDPAAGGQQQPAPGDPARRPTRKDRRAEYQANVQLKQALDAMTKQNESLNRRIADMTERVGQSIEASRPPPVDPFIARKKTLDDKWDRVVARLEKDPTAAGEFRDLQLEYGRLAADEQQSKASAAQPRPPSALANALFTEFHWLHPESGDPDARAMVNGETAKLVRRERRNMEDPNVRYTTLRQAAAIVAKELGYPLPATVVAPDGNGTSARERLAGTGGRSGGGGGGGSDPWAGMDGDIEHAATIMYPNVDKPTAIAKWKAGPGRRHVPAR